MEHSLKDVSIYISALVDEDLGVLNADESFYRFCGANSLLPFSRSVHEDDLQKLIKAMEDATGAEAEHTAIRLSSAEGEYTWMYVEVRKTEQCNNGRKTYNISMINAKELGNTITSVENTVTAYSQYMGLSESLFFEYYIDEDYFRTFAMPDGCCTIDLVKGPLEESVMKVFGRGEVKALDKRQYEALCTAIKAGESHIKKEISLAIIGDTEDRQTYIVNAKTIAGADGKPIVRGTFSRSGMGKSVEEVGVVSDMRDPGTDLLNKRAITDYVTNLIDSKPDYNVTIAVIDVDDFKTVNDTYGHQFGDEVLSRVADIIKAAVGRKGVCGRIGGDEMFIVVEGLVGNEAIRSVLRTIKSNISWLFHDDERNINKITCSIGSASYPEDADNYEELFRIADKMLYLAKEKGKNRYVIYHNDLHYNYVYGEGATTENEKKAIFRYKKTQVVSTLVREYEKATDERKQELYEMISIGFGVDTIAYYDLNNYKKTMLYGDITKPEANALDDGTFVQCDNLTGGFRDDGLFVVDNIIFIEQRYPNVYKQLEALGLSQVILYLVGGDAKNLDKMIVFGRYEQDKKWAEQDVNFLLILGDLIGRLALGGE